MRIRRKLQPDEQYEVDRAMGNGWLVRDNMGRPGLHLWCSMADHEPILEERWEDVTARTEGLGLLPLDRYRLVHERLWRRKVIATVSGLTRDFPQYEDEPVNAIRIERKSSP